MGNICEEVKSELKDYGLVSVVMPTYKQTELLHKAVKSVLAQTYANIELIVIDDNKDTDLKRQNKEFFEELNNTRIVYLQNEKNLGSTATRNRGIGVSKGKYVSFLDDDDIYVNDKIEKQVSLMAENNAQLSVCNLVLVDDESLKVVDRRRRRYLKRKKESVFMANFKYHMTGMGTIMFESHFLKEIGGFDAENLGDEYYLMVKALEKEPRFVHLDYDGVIALVHSKSGLSGFENKIKMENILMDFQSRYFDKISKSDVRYLKMRHNVVIAFAYKKNKRIFKCIGYALKAFFIAPLGLIKIIIGMDR